MKEEQTKKKKGKKINEELMKKMADVEEICLLR